MQIVRDSESKLWAAVISLIFLIAILITAPTKDDLMDNTPKYYSEKVVLN